MDDLQVRVRRMWKYLNDNGIYTLEELDKAIEEMSPLDISIMVAPIKIDKQKNVD